MTPTELCAACGACCDGSVFKSLPIGPGDAIPNSDGLVSLHAKAHATLFKLPCPSRRDGGCNIYGTRPKVCRDFECSGLKALKAGKLSDEEARRRAANKTVHKYGEDMNQETTLKQKLLQGRGTGPAPKINEAAVAQAAEAAIAAAVAGHDGDAKLRALQRLVQHVQAELETLMAEVKAARGGAARALRKELAAKTAASE